MFKEHVLTCAIVSELLAVGRGNLCDNLIFCNTKYFMTINFRDNDRDNGSARVMAALSRCHQTPDIIPELLPAHLEFLLDTKS